MLTASDRASQDVGTLLEWELITTPALPGACVPCLGAAGVPSATGGGRKLELAPNHPNPFSRATEIAFQLARTGHATLRVYDVAGQVVATLRDGELSAGAHRAIWDGKDDTGRQVASGLYFYRLTTGEGRGVRRMLLIR